MIPNESWLKHIYQQWSCNQDDFDRSYQVFVKIAAGVMAISHEAMLEELKKYSWFIWPR